MNYYFKVIIAISFLLNPSYGSSESTLKTYTLDNSKLEVNSIANPASPNDSIELIISNQNISYISYDSKSNHDGRYTFVIYPKSNNAGTQYNTTKKLVGHQVGIYLNEKLLHQATLNEPLTGPVAFELNKEKADTLLKALRPAVDINIDKIRKEYDQERYKFIEANGSFDEKVMLSTELYSKNEFDQVIKLLSPLGIPNNKDDALGICTNLGVSYQQTKKWKEMIELFDECTKKGVNKWSFNKEIAQAHAALNDHKKAYQTLLEYTDTLEKINYAESLKVQLAEINNPDNKTIDSSQKEELRKSIEKQINEIMASLS